MVGRRLWRGSVRDNKYHLTFMLTRFEQFCNRKAVEYGGKFDKSQLNPAFVGAFNSGYRVEVEFCSSDGKPYEVKRGRIGVTTGWRPVFLLMLTRRSTGSMYTIGPNDRIVSVVSK